MAKENEPLLMIGKYHKYPSRIIENINNRPSYFAYSENGE